MIAWRHDIHQNPELSIRVFRTAKLIADHLKSLNLDVVKTEIAPTGVIGILRGGNPHMHSSIVQLDDWINVGAISTSSYERVKNCDPCASALKVYLRISIHSDYKVTPIGPLRFVQ